MEKSEATWACLSFLFFAEVPNYQCLRINIFSLLRD